eukprot:TRINITY_DN500_c0_g1_i1.p1 TRINITY_DN500_c0_g1~~TRINITY_DN500_c0_g1_i1.p1  ORF type:complete len:280 (+),score=85.19 TRINITY_DN500_c0_g1_i1:140-979(+)
MSRNLSDTRQRAYRPLDAYSADGFWVEESQYNRRGGKTRVLCGNWGEQRQMEQEKERREEGEIDPDDIFKREKRFVTEEDLDEVGIRLTKPIQTAKWTYGPQGEPIPTFDDSKSAAMPSVHTLQSSKFLTSVDPKSKFEASTTSRSSFCEPAHASRVKTPKDVIYRSMEEDIMQEVLQEDEDRLREIEDDQMNAFKTMTTEIRDRFSGPVSSKGKDDGEQEGEERKSVYHDEPLTFYSHQIGKSHAIFHSDATKSRTIFAKSSKFSKPIGEFALGVEKE